MTKGVAVLGILLGVSGCCDRPDYYAQNNPAKTAAVKNKCAIEQNAVIELWKYQCRNPKLTHDELLKHASVNLREYSAHYHPEITLSDIELAENCGGILKNRGGYYDYGKSLGIKSENYCLEQGGLEWGYQKTISSTCPIGNPIGF
jgi:hypothetical protein